MFEPSLQSFGFFMGALAVVCLGSERPIRHHRVNQRISPSGSYDNAGESDSNDPSVHGVNKELNSQQWTNYRKPEMKSVENLFRKSQFSGIKSMDMKSDKIHDNKETQEKKTAVPKEKTGVSIKFSGKNYQINRRNSYLNIKSPRRDFTNSQHFTRRNKTSLWPLTYSPGTVEVILNNTSINVTTEAGNGVFLPCRVGHLGDTQISWIRRRDWHVITSGDSLYSYDHRFSVLHDTSSHDWTLHIKFVTHKDEGTYECQVSTDTGIISLFVNLSVIEPEAKIIGQSQYHINKGSSIYITCVVHNNLGAPQHVFWHHNGELLNFLRDRPEISITTEKPVVISKINHSYVSGTNFSNVNNIYDIKSHLKVDAALDIHSGNYSCSTSNSIAASLIVFITEGDKTAAVQRIDSGAEVSGLKLWTLFFINLALLGSLR